MTQNSHTSPFYRWGLQQEQNKMSYKDAYGKTVTWLTEAHESKQSQTLNVKIWILDEFEFYKYKHKKYFKGSHEDK